MSTWSPELKKRRRAMVNKLIKHQEAYGTIKDWCAHVGLNKKTYGGWKNKQFLPSGTFADWIEEYLREEKKAAQENGHTESPSVPPRSMGAFKPRPLFETRPDYKSDIPTTNPQRLMEITIPDGCEVSVTNRYVIFRFNW